MFDTCRGISPPAGGEFLCPWRQRNQNAPGDASDGRRLRFAPPRPIGRFPRTPFTGAANAGALAVIAKARVAQLNGFSSITAAAELSVAFGDCFYRWKARLLGGRGSSSAQGIGGRVRAPAPTQMQELSPLFVGAGPRPARGRPHGAAPTKFRGSFRLCRRGRRPRRPAGAHCAPLRRKTAPGRWFGNGRRKSGTAPTPIFHKPRAQWPGGNLERHSDFARRNFSARFKG